MLIDAFSRSDVRKQRRDNNVSLLLRINVSTSSRQLFLLEASMFHTRRLETSTVVERRTPEREVGGSTLTQVDVLCP